MAPIVPPSSAFLTAFSEAKDFIWQHYVVVIVGIVAVRFIYLRYLHPYGDIPGPFLATISPLWKVRGALNGTLHKDITAAHRKYGPIFRISPDEVSISDPEAIKVIYAHGAGFTKVRNPLNSTDSRPIITVSGDLARTQKVYSPKQTRQLMPLNDDLSPMHTPCLLSWKWNLTSTAPSRKCRPDWLDLQIHPLKSIWHFGCRRMLSMLSANLRLADHSDTFRLDRILVGKWRI
jgi:hypothetical protein